MTCGSFVLYKLVMEAAVGAVDALVAVGAGFAGGTEIFYYFKLLSIEGKIWLAIKVVVELCAETHILMSAVKVDIAEERTFFCLEYFAVQ